MGPQLSFCQLSLYRPPRTSQSNSFALIILNATVLASERGVTRTIDTKDCHVPRYHHTKFHLNSYKGPNTKIFKAFTQRDDDPTSLLKQYLTVSQPRPKLSGREKKNHQPTGNNSCLTSLNCKRTGSNKVE